MGTFQQHVDRSFLAEPLPETRQIRHHQPDRAPIATLVGLGYALWLEWFAFRLTLGIGTLPAVGLVAVDVSIGVFLAGLGVAG